MEGHDSNSIRIPAREQYREKKGTAFQVKNYRAASERQTTELQV